MGGVGGLGVGGFVFGRSFSSWFCILWLLGGDSNTNMLYSRDTLLRP